MIHRSVVFYLLNIVIINISGAPVTQNDFDILNNLTSCPSLADSALIKNSTYLSICEKVSLSNLPNKIYMENINKFYCVGLFSADLNLCEILNKTDYKLPDDHDLEIGINAIRAKRPEETCKLFSNISSFNSPMVSINKSLQILRKSLIGNSCLKICSDLSNDLNTDKYCSILYYLYDIIQNVTTVQSKTVLNTQTHVNKQNTSHPSPIDESKPKSPTITEKPKILDEKSDKEETTTVKFDETAHTAAEPQKVVISANQPESKQNNDNQQQTVDDTVKIQKTERNEQLNIPIKDDVNNDTPKDQKFDDGMNTDYENEPGIENNQEQSPGSANEVNPVELPDNRENPNARSKHFDEVEESNFFSYFMFISVMFIAGYVVYHNKQKIMALVLEGRRDRNSRRRPSTSNYRKLNSNLEEAVTSKCSGSASHVIY